MGSVVYLARTMIGVMSHVVALIFIRRLYLDLVVSLVT